MIISRTPLRVSFVGGGTDIDYFYKKHNGSVISTAIDKYIYITVKKRFDKKIVLNYRKRESVFSVHEIQHELIKACLEMLNITSSIEIQSIADIPSSGSGLGSSSAFTVGVLNALTNFIGEPVNQIKLAEMACKVEIDICGSPIGKQDQYGCALGGIKQVNFNANDSVELIKIDNHKNLYSNLETKMILVNSNITRSASQILKKQKNNFSSNEKNLIKIFKSVPEFGNYLVNQEFDKIYNSINDYWENKKILMNDSSLISIYNEYVPNLCYTGKICGAGGGGYFLFFRKENTNIAEEKYIPLKIDTLGSIIIYNNYI